MCIIGLSGEERTEEIFETVMTENFLELVPDTKPEIQEAQRIPRTINAKKLISKHIISNYRRLKIKKY